MILGTEDEISLPGFGHLDEDLDVADSSSNQCHHLTAFVGAWLYCPDRGEHNSSHCSCSRRIEADRTTE